MLWPAAISAVAVMVLRSHRSGMAPALGFAGALVAAASWRLGAFAGSVLVSGGSYLVLRRLPLHWTPKLALVPALLSGFLVLGPIGLLAR